MSSVRALVLRAPGINCDEETVEAWSRAGADVRKFHVRELTESPQVLRQAQIVTIPGGFSYGDDIAGGRILAIRLMHGVLDELQDFVHRGGLLVGICNGLQVLVRMGFLPGIGKGQPMVSMSRNISGRYEDRWVRMKVCTDRCPLFEKDEVFHVPVAHAEGRLAATSPEALERLRAADAVALRYVGRQGGPADYPDNPSGTVDGIAGLVDPTGRVVGMMPHPERYLSRVQHPCWTREEREAPLGEAGEGLRIFQRGVRMFR